VVLGLSVEWSFGCSDESCVNIAAVLPGGDGTWVLWRLFGARLTSPVNPVCRYCVARYCFVDGSLLAYGDADAGDCCCCFLFSSSSSFWLLLSSSSSLFSFPLRPSNAAISFDGADSMSKNFSTFVRMTRSSNFFSLDLPDRVKNECRRLQANRERRGRYPKRDIDNMQNWAKTWQISFNYDKCKVMHFGKEEQNTLKLGSLGNDSIE
jgi:hypothetical protein